MGFASQDPAPTPDAAEVRSRIAARVRDLRRRSNRSLAEVAAEAGIGKSTLHAIEAGVANPGIETLWALARALGVPFGTLVERPGAVTRVVRADEAPRIASESSAIQALLLTSTSHAARVEVYALEVGDDTTGDAGHEHAAGAHTAGTIEHVLVTRGGLRVGPADAPVELAPGDLVSFPGDVPHVYQPLAPGTRAVLLIEYT